MRHKPENPIAITSNIFTKRRIASVETIFPRPCQLHRQNFRIALPSMHLNRFMIIKIQCTASNCKIKTVHYQYHPTALLPGFWKLLAWNKKRKRKQSWPIYKQVCTTQNNIARFSISHICNKHTYYISILPHRRWINHIGTRELNTILFIMQ